MFRSSPFDIRDFPSDAILGSREADREALLALYWSSGGPRWKKQQGWVEGAPDLSSWHGVGVNSFGRVIRLNLQKNDLDGE